MLLRSTWVKVGLAFLALIVGPNLVSAADELREKALKLNQTSGTQAMSKALGELLKDEKATKELLASAEKMLKEEKNPLNYNACYILGKAAGFFKNVDQAKAFYKSAAEQAAKLGSAGKVTDVFDALIDMFAQNKKYGEAIAACQEFLDLEVNDKDSPINQMKPFILEKLVQNMARKGDTEKAIEMANELVKRDEGGWYFLRLKGEVLREAGKYDDSAEAYLEAVERLKKSDRLKDEQKTRIGQRLRYTLSGIYLDAKKEDKCLELLETLVKEDPDNSSYLNDLGFTLADLNKRLDDAEKYIRLALEKDKEARKKIEGLDKEDDKDSAGYLDSLGWVLFRKKKFDDAKKYLKMAAEDKDGKHAEIYDHLADVHMALGEKKEAIKIWEEALKLENVSRRDDERKKKIKEKLEAAKKDPGTKEPDKKNPDKKDPKKEVKDN